LGLIKGGKEDQEGFTFSARVDEQNLRVLTEGLLSPMNFEKTRKGR